MEVTPGFEKMYGVDPDEGMPLARLLPEWMYDLAESRRYQFWKNYDQSSFKAFLDRNDRKYQEAEDLAAACAQCMVWCEQHPLYAQKQFMYQGALTIHNEPRKRVVTLARLLDFTNISASNWHYGITKRGDEWVELKKQVEQWIYHDKFEGVNAGFYNASIIGADLGLKTLASLELAGGKEPIKVQSTKPLSDDELKDALAERGLPTELLGSFLGLPPQEDEDHVLPTDSPGGDPEDFDAGS